MLHKLTWIHTVMHPYTLAPAPEDQAGTSFRNARSTLWDRHGTDQQGDALEEALSDVFFTAVSTVTPTHLGDRYSTVGLALVSQKLAPWMRAETLVSKGSGTICSLQSTETRECAKTEAPIAIQVLQFRYRCDVKDIYIYIYTVQTTDGTPCTIWCQFDALQERNVIRLGSWISTPQQLTIELPECSPVPPILYNIYDRVHFKQPMELLLWRQFDIHKMAYSCTPGKKCRHLTWKLDIHTPATDNGTSRMLSRVPSLVQCLRKGTGGFEQQWLKHGAHTCRRRVYLQNTQWHSRSSNSCPGAAGKRVTMVPREGPKSTQARRRPCGAPSTAKQ